MKTCVIFPAAGKSTRFENNEKKQFAELEGRAVWLRTVELFCNRADVCQLILVINPEDRELVLRRFAANLAFLGIQLIDGGQERCDSVQKALDRVSPEATHIAIHDAVRPCVETRQIDAVFKAAELHGAAILATRLVHTLKKEKESAFGVIEKTLPRKHLWLAQTPQVFRADWLQDSYKKRINDFLPTDDSELLEATGHPVQLVECGLTNLKITTATDLLLAENILKSQPKATGRKFHPFYED